MSEIVNLLLLQSNSAIIEKAFIGQLLANYQSEHQNPGRLGGFSLRAQFQQPNVASGTLQVGLFFYLTKRTCGTKS